MKDSLLKWFWSALAGAAGGLALAVVGYLQGDGRWAYCYAASLIENVCDTNPWAFWTIVVASAAVGGWTGLSWPKRWGWATGVCGSAVGACAAVGGLGLVGSNGIAAQLLVLTLQVGTGFWLGYLIGVLGGSAWSWQGDRVKEEAGKAFADWLKKYTKRSKS